MIDIDLFLEIIENNTRREILKRLVESRCYPLMLSRELKLTQQAVMKHLALLEKSYMVKVCGYEKNIKGPPRKMYELEGRYTLIVDLTPNMFYINMEEIPRIEIDIPRKKAEEMLDNIEKELRELDKRRLELLALKDYILSIIK